MCRPAALQVLMHQSSGPLGPNPNSAGPTADNAMALLQLHQQQQQQQLGPMAAAAAAAALAGKRPRPAQPGQPLPVLQGAARPGMPPSAANSFAHLLGAAAGAAGAGGNNGAAALLAMQVRQALAMAQRSGVNQVRA